MTSPTEHTGAPTADRNPDGSPSWVPFGPEADKRRAENDEYVRLLIAGSSWQRPGRTGRPKKETKP